MADWTCIRCRRPEWGVYRVDGGVACWECLTIPEQRREACQCERCGTQHQDEVVGWIVTRTRCDHRVLCAGCITFAEDVVNTNRLLGLVDKCKQRAAEENQDELAMLGEYLGVRIERKRDETVKLRDLLDEAV